MGKIYKNNVLYTNYTAVHSGFTPIGTVISVMSNHAPANYLICDGSVYNISAYPELANHFATEFGSKNYFGGDGTTTFAVPDLRGEFLRGTGTNSHENQGSGANVGVHQDGTIHVGVRTSDQFYITNNASGATNTDYKLALSNPIRWIGFNSANVGTVNDVDYTSRPTNTSVLLCIAIKNIFMDAGSNYSTEEQVVGTWIDGKPLYQRTVEFSTGQTINASSWWTSNISATNIDTPVEAMAHCKANADVSLWYSYSTPLGVSNSSGTSHMSNLEFFNLRNNTGIIVYAVTIKYTKITD